MHAFTDRTVLITGASAGIGRALAFELAGRRPRLVLAARDRGRLEEVAKACEAKGARTLVVPTDVTDETACKALVEAAITHFEGVDVLVNNAGATMLERFEDLPDLRKIEHLIRLNYLGAVYCTYHALPSLRARRGRIVAVASVAGLTGVPRRTGYSASKHAMIGFFDSLRVELRGSGVSVTVIAPDFVRTEIHRRAAGGGESPLDGRRILSAERCAAMIARAVARRRRLLITSRRGRAGRWLELVAPGLVDRIAQAATERGR